MGSRPYPGRFVTVAAAVVVHMAGCDGGDGGGGQPQEARSVVASGPVAGFGSVYLNGVRYETQDAEVRVDGAVARMADLQVGHVITLEGRVSEGNSRAVFVRLDRDLIGPVRSIASGALQFVVLGQTVTVSSETSFGASIEPASLLGLKIGDVVEVSGLRNSSDRIEATRVDLRSADGSYLVAGTVSALDSAQRRFLIDALVVDYSAAGIEGFPSGQPGNGDRVRVVGPAPGAGGMFAATRVTSIDDARLLPPTGGTMRLDGRVTRLASAADLDVAGWKVATTATTEFANGAATDLALDRRVEVEGSVDPAGVLAASRLRFCPPNGVRIVSEVKSIDLDNRRLTSMGVAATTGAATRFEDRTDAALRTFRLADLHTGDWIDLRGYEEPPGSGKTQATRLVRIDAQSAHNLRGPLRQADDPDFAILEVEATTDAATLFLLEGAGQVAAAEFFGQPPGRVVEASGAFDGTTLAAKLAVVKTRDD